MPANISATNGPIFMKFETFKLIMDKVITNNSYVFKVLKKWQSCLFTMRGHPYEFSENDNIVISIEPARICLIGIQPLSAYILHHIYFLLATGLKKNQNQYLFSRKV